jgi:hypothetical protein
MIVAGWTAVDRRANVTSVYPSEFFCRRSLKNGNDEQRDAYKLDSLGHHAVERKRLWSACRPWTTEWRHVARIRRSSPAASAAGSD